MLGASHSNPDSVYRVTKVHGHSRKAPIEVAMLTVLARTGNLGPAGDLPRSRLFPIYQMAGCTAAVLSETQLEVELYLD
jgi:hypothetical protein